MGRKGSNAGEELMGQGTKMGSMSRVSRKSRHSGSEGLRDSQREYCICWFLYLQVLGCQCSSGSMMPRPEHPIPMCYGLSGAESMVASLGIGVKPPLKLPTFK